MRIQITARHCDVPDRIQGRVREQVEGLARYDPRLSSATVTFEEEKHLKKVEAVLAVDREEPVVATGEGEEYRAAVDEMVDRAGRILRERRSQRRNHQGPALREQEISVPGADVPPGSPDAE